LKRSPQWEQEAREGLSEAKWRKEYLIDYTALYGEKVFPEIITGRSNIVVEPFEIPKGQPCWAGLDYGARNPTSVHIYTEIDGCWYAVWELYKPCENIPALVAELQQCPYWGQVKWVAADPSIFARNQQRYDGVPTSVAAMMQEAGVYNLIAGVNDEGAWIAKMRDLWKDPADPRFKIMKTCPAMINEFSEAVYTTPTQRMEAAFTYREDIADFNNHALDDCKYHFNSKPTYQHKPIKWPKMVDRWKN
jgi:hypothetical protein